MIQCFETVLLQLFFRKEGEKLISTSIRAEKSSQLYEIVPHDYFKDDFPGK